MHGQGDLGNVLPENNALDSLGTNHGTLMNGASFAVGLIGQAFSFDGVDDYVSLGSGLAVGSMKVQAWVQVNPSENVGYATQADGGDLGAFRQAPRTAFPHH